MAWTCQRVCAGVKCGYVNENRWTICRHCGKKRPAKRKPKHMAALNVPYAEYVQINGGEHCGICGFIPEPKAGRRLDRDHDHRTGKPRGLLCHMCNRTLGNRVDAKWLMAAYNYVYRANVR